MLATKKKKWLLSALSHDIPSLTIQGTTGISVSDITLDSRNVQKGSLFCALPGSTYDGREYIISAIERGAVAILLPENSDLSRYPSHITYLTHPDPRSILGTLAAKFFNGVPEHIVAVTGTNGKTSIVQFCQQLWHFLGYKSSSMGTLGVLGDVCLEQAGLTTADPILLQQNLSLLKEQGVTHVALEASSHGISQYRLDGTPITAAGFTHISRDHLDYHLTMEAYLEAKLQLFSRLLLKNAPAVLNRDIPEFARCATLCREYHHPIFTYGTFPQADLRLVHLTPSLHGQQIILEYQGKHYETFLSLIGSFQAMNILCALGLVGVSEPELPIGALIEYLPKLKAAPGRMEQVLPQVPVYVDYAHTPDALQHALQSLRPHTPGKLWVVFGCGGDRDPGKRVLMGKVAKDYADQIVVTDDNPRSEDPAKIREAIISACEEAYNIGDRREAIAFALRHLSPEDVVLIAGKGHESTQEVAGKKYEFHDVKVAKSLISS